MENKTTQSTAQTAAQRHAAQAVAAARNQRQERESMSAGAYAGTVASTAGGAVAGTILGTLATEKVQAANRNDLEGLLLDEQDFEAVAEDVVEVVEEPQVPVEPATYHHVPAPTPVETEPEIEIISYERVEGEYDFAVVEANGVQMAVVDSNLDGYADVILVDQDGDGEVDQRVDLDPHEMAMQPLQDAFGFDPTYIAEQTPDYVNNADVDNYLA